MIISMCNYFVFNIAQIGFKYKAEEQINKNEKLEKITISKSDFITNKEYKELWYNNNLYDIESYLLIGDSVTAIVFHDNQEEEITKIVFGISDNEYVNNGKESNSRIETHKIIPDENKDINEIYYLKSFFASTKIPTFSTLKFQFFPIVFAKVSSPPPDYIS